MLIFFVEAGRMCRVFADVLSSILDPARINVLRGPCDLRHIVSMLGSTTAKPVPRKSHRTYAVNSLRPAQTPILHKTDFSPGA